MNDFIFFSHRNHRFSHQTPFFCFENYLSEFISLGISLLLWFILHESNRHFHVKHIDNDVLMFDEDHLLKIGKKQNDY